MPNPENILNQGFHTNPERINKEGRPKGVRNRATIAKEWLEVEQSFRNPITGKEEVLQQQDIMTLALIKKAREGDVNAFKELMDSAYGKLTQPLIHEGNEEKPLLFLKHGSNPDNSNRNI